MMWMQRQTTCPTCRAPILQNDKDDAIVMPWGLLPVADPAPLAEGLPDPPPLGPIEAFVENSLEQLANAFLGEDPADFPVPALPPRETVHHPPSDDVPPISGSEFTFAADLSASSPGTKPTVSTGGAGEAPALAPIPSSGSNFQFENPTPLPPLRPLTYEDAKWTIAVDGEPPPDPMLQGLMRQEKLRRMIEEHRLQEIEHMPPSEKAIFTEVRRRVDAEYAQRERNRVRGAAAAAAAAPQMDNVAITTSDISHPGGSSSSSNPFLILADKLEAENASGVPMTEETLAELRELQLQLTKCTNMSKAAATSKNTVIHALTSCGIDSFSATSSALTASSTGTTAVEKNTRADHRSMNHNIILKTATQHENTTVAQTLEVDAGLVPLNDNSSSSSDPFLAWAQMLRAERAKGVPMSEEAIAKLRDLQVEVEKWAETVATPSTATRFHSSPITFS
jgi:hypothetical protein